MKNIIIICILASILSCNQNNKSTLAAFSVLKFAENNTKRIEPSEFIKKYIVVDEPLIALVNAKIIDGRGGMPLLNQTIIIDNGYFRSVGGKNEVSIPENAKVIDAKGKTIIPGIVGVHNHLHIPGYPFIGNTAVKLYLAAGVTTIQTCGSASPYKEIELSDKILKGLEVGPDIVTSGPYFTGIGGNPNMIIPRNESHLRDTIQHWIDMGVRWFKVYRHIAPTDLKIIIDEAHRHNAKVTGHLCSITFEEASNLGIDGIEHGFNSVSDFRKNKSYGLCDGSREYIDSLDVSDDRVRQLHQLMINNNVFLTSTLSIYEASIPTRAFADNRTLKAMSPSSVSEYRARRERFDSSTEEGLVREKRLRRIMDFEYQFFKMGGTLTAGVDAGRHNLPGYGDQRNFELLIEAGFTTEEAIMIMTGNGAKVLSKENIGTIEVGKRADFVVLNGDLVKDPSVIRNIEYVFKEGYGFDSRLLIKEIEGKIGVE